MEENVEIFTCNLGTTYLDMSTHAFCPKYRQWMGICTAACMQMPPEVTYRHACFWKACTSGGVSLFRRPVGSCRIVLVQSRWWRKEAKVCAYAYMCYTGM